MAGTNLLPRDGGFIGVTKARLALIDQQTGVAIAGDAGIPGADENGIYTVTTKMDGGVSSAALSGLAATITRIWGNNAVADISIGKAQPSVAFTTNFLNHLVEAAILGRASDGKGGFDLEGRPVDLAMEIVSNTVLGGGVHFCFFDGKMTPGDLSLGTNNENETRVQSALTFTPFGNVDDKVGKIYYDNDAGFEQATLDQEVFGVIDTTAPVKPADVAVSSVTLDPTAVSVEVGKTATVTATVVPTDATDKTVTYTSGDETVATVASDGTVTGVKAGTTTVVANADGKATAAVVTVTAATTE